MGFWTAEYINVNEPVGSVLAEQQEVSAAVQGPTLCTQRVQSCMSGHSTCIAIWSPS